MVMSQDHRGPSINKFTSLGLHLGVPIVYGNELLNGCKKCAECPIDKEVMPKWLSDYVSFWKESG